MHRAPSGFKGALWDVGCENNQAAAVGRKVKPKPALVPILLHQGYYLFLRLLFSFFATSGFAQDTTNCTTPSATIEAVSSGCQSATIFLKLKAAVGAPPFDLVVNGITYKGVEVGQTFAEISADQSIWGTSAAPEIPTVADGQSVEVGVKFKAAVNGYITGIRFYKGAGNTGTHIGSLWSAAGTRLASARFVNETSSGWQVVTFPDPVAVTANTTYVASYLSPEGFYAFSGDYFTNNSVVNGTLTALQSSADQPNGVYKYGSGFPDQSFRNSNYWVDVLFTDTATTTRQTKFILTRIVDSHNCTAAGDALSVDTVTMHPLPSGVLAAEEPTCEKGNTKLVFNATSGTGPFDLEINGKTYSNIESGAVINTGVAAVSATSIWSNSVFPITATVANDDSSCELGVRFKANVSGKVLGVRFYKGVGNTGTHTGSLWAPDRSLLATGTFSNETPIGWQQLNFSSPVQIEANKIYTASYHAPAGRYSISTGYFADSAAGNALITAIRSSVADSNGVFKYGPGGTYPDKSFNTSNYWVDVVFKPDTVFTPEKILFQLASISDANACKIKGGPLYTLAVVPVTCAPTLMDSLVPVTCAPQQLKLVFKKPIRCATVAADGSDFIVQGSYAVNVRGAAAECDSSGYAASLKIDLEKTLQQQGQFQLLLKSGSDGNTLLDANDQQTPVGSALAFQVKDTVNAAFTYNIHYGCNADTVLFQHAGGNGVTSWLWKLDETGTSTAQNTQAVYSIFNKKNIQLEVSNGFCADTAAAAFVLDNTLSIDFTMKAKPCTDEPVAFTSMANGQIVSHQWVFGDGAASDQVSPLHTYTLQNPGVYQVRYSVTDAFGCTKSITKPLDLNSNCTVYVPNAFTPGGDGHNDFFGPLNVAQAEQYEFRVLNRWGQVLFYTQTSSQGWDGQYKGHPQAAGTYIWVLRYADNYSKKIMERKGTFVLIR